MPAEQTRSIFLGIFNLTALNLHKCLTYKMNMCMCLLTCWRADSQWNFKWINFVISPQATELSYFLMIFVKAEDFHFTTCIILACTIPTHTHICICICVYMQTFWLHTNTTKHDLPYNHLMQWKSTLYPYNIQ